MDVQFRDGGQGVAALGEVLDRPPRPIALGSQKGYMLKFETLKVPSIFLSHGN
jgi:hypothetical protein